MLPGVTQYITGTWARNVTQINTQNNSCALFGLEYSDGLMSNKPTALSLATEIAAILSCTNQERINASKEIIASLWNYTRQEESTAFFMGMIMRVMLPEKDFQCLHTLGQLIDLAEQRHEELLEFYRKEREAKIEAIRARNRPHPAITACTMVYAGDDCGDW